MPFSERTHVERMAFVEARLGSLGLQIQPTSRFDQMRRVFRNTDGSPRTITHDSPDLDTGLESLRDYHLLEFALDHAPAGAKGALADGFIERLEVVVKKDSVDPVATSKITRGRDTMVELFVAAVMVKAGNNSVAFGTPDVRVLLDGAYFFIEAKRPKTSDGVIPAIETAVGQLKTRGCPGAVFVDTSLAWNPKNERILRPLEHEAFQALHRQSISEMVRRLHDELQHKLTDSPACVVCFQDHQMRQVPGLGWRPESCLTHVERRAMSTGLRRRALLFQRALSAAFPDR